MCIQCEEGKDQAVSYHSVVSRIACKLGNENFMRPVGIINLKVVQKVCENDPKSNNMAGRQFSKDD